MDSRQYVPSPLVQQVACRDGITSASTVTMPQVTIAEPTSDTVSFREAISLTPFSSIYPFDSSIIPIPQLDVAATKPLTNYVSTKEFAALNADATSSNNSLPVQRTLAEIQGLLDPSKITTFKFKPVLNDSVAQLPVNTSVSSLFDTLEPISKMVLTRSSVAFAFTTPGDGKKRKLPVSKSFRPAAESSKLQGGKPISPTIGHKSTEPRGSVVKQSLPSNTGKSVVSRGTPNINLNISAKSVKQDRPAEVNDPSQTSTEQIEEDGEDSLAKEAPEPVQRSDAALRSLQKYLTEVARGEKQAVAPNEVQSNAVMQLADGRFCLTSHGLKKLRPLLQAAIDFKCFASVPAEELLRIQKLCFNGLENYKNYDITLNVAWGESDTIMWAQSLSMVEFSLMSARSALSIMGGARSEKKLYSEDLTHQSLTLLRNVLDGIIIPLAEQRTSSSLFRFLLPHKRAIASVFATTEKLLESMAQLVSSIELSDLVASLEDCALKLVFLETAHSDKDSTVPLQNFDSLRLAGMDLLCRVFQKNPQHRQGIVADILSSLKKLPLAKSSARHFKLSDGGNIQPVSALFMRLVQASGSFIHHSMRGRGHTGLTDDDDRNAGPRRESGSLPRFNFTINSEDQAALHPSAALGDLKSLTSYLHASQQETATIVCNHLINQAKQSTKTGDDPYRSLLEMFVEDFTTCLDNPSWPAAVVLIRTMLHICLGIVNEKTLGGIKSPVSAVNLALELLGIMGAKMAKFRSLVQRTKAPADGSELDQLWNFLLDLATSVLEDQAKQDTIVQSTGPYRAILEYLGQRSTNDAHLSSAVSYVALDWAINLLHACTANQEEGKENAQLAYRLRMMIISQEWLSNELNFAHVSPAHCKLAYAITILNADLFALYQPILVTFFQSMSRVEVTVRSKSLKSITQLIETDPSILDGKVDIYQRILEDGLGDPSSQVRESALGLISTCLGLRPQYEEVTRPAVLERLTDMSVGVRKRSMRLCKDLYTKSKSQQVRTKICGKLLIRLQDQEESVRELARQLIDEIWIVPFAAIHTPSAATELAMKNHVSLVVRALNTAREIVGEQVILTLVKGIIGSVEKTASPSFKVCEQLVSGMFELVPNSSSDDDSVPSGPEALHVLVVFAKIAQNLFTFEQIRSLRPYIESIPQQEDPATSVAALHIFRRVVSGISIVHKEFLQDTKMKLQSFLSRGINAQVVDELIACLWAVSRLLGSTAAMASLACSSLRGVQKTAAKNSWDTATTSGFVRYCLITGTVTKYGEKDLEAHPEIFTRLFSTRQNKAVSEIMLDVLVPLVAKSATQPKEVRRAIIESVAMICQANPRNYTDKKVYKVFEDIFKERNHALESLVLGSFLAFLVAEEQRVVETTEDSQKDLAKPELAVMGGGTNYDDVASATTRRFLSDLTRISVEDITAHSKLALEVLGSINRQGLVHPKETVVTFMTLETCPVPVISELAYKEHKRLHEKHEQVLEREYPKAIHSIFEYQRDIVKDIRGARSKPDGSFEPKLTLTMDVLRISKSKNRQKFLEKLIKMVDFDPAKSKAADMELGFPQLSQFLLENVAFFEYTTVGELMIAINAQEKIFSTTGSSLAQFIESDIFQVRMDATVSQAKEIVSPPVVDELKLRRLTSGSMILSCLYETRTHLRRTWGQGSSKKDKLRVQSKDLSKAPVRMPGATGEKYWEAMNRIMQALDNKEQMLAQCRQFVELITVDNEVRVDEDEEEELDVDIASASEDEDVSAPSQGRGRKRKAPPSTPGSRKKRTRSNSVARHKGRPKKQARPAGHLEVSGEMDWIQN